MPWGVAKSAAVPEPLAEPLTPGLPAMVTTFQTEPERESSRMVSFALSAT